MSSLTGHRSLATLVSDADRLKPRTGAQSKPLSLGQAGMLCLIVGVAVLLRIYRMDAFFASSDQVAMANLVQHTYGLKWMFSHIYGPVLPVVARLIAELHETLGMPITETTFRLPSVISSLLQLWFTWLLLRRLRVTQTEAMAALAVCAVLPTALTEAHYGWPYCSFWLLFGTIALWATSAYMQEGRGVYMLIAGAALTLHCLNNVYSFGLPATVLVLWTLYIRGTIQSGNRSAVLANGLSRPIQAVLGFGLPCFIALGVIFFAWQWTGGGQLGHLLFKHERGASGVHLSQLIGLFGLGTRHYGYLFAPIVLIGLLAATYRGVRGAWLGALALWFWLELLPLTLLADWTRLDNGPYFYPVDYMGGLFAGIFCVRLVGWISSRVERDRVRRWGRGAAVVVFAAAFSHMTIGGIDRCLGGSVLQAFTGMQRTALGDILPDTGTKAAGWYVRKHVPMEAVILSVHRNVGMEVSVAEYYCDRRVVAGYDLPPAILPEVVQAMHQDVDVIIVEPADEHLVQVLSEFEPVCSLARDGRIVRRIYARKTADLTPLTAETEELNVLYDQTESADRVPTPLPSSSRFLPVFAKYQKLVNCLKGRP
jgi:hypothetical protein